MDEIGDDYLDKSPDAGRMGKAAEYLVASVCILTTRGRLNVSTSLVDDEGVDLVFHLRGSTATLAVQVKARMADGAVVGRGRFQAFIRSTTFRPRTDLDLLFVLIDNAKGAIEQAWLVPSPNFEASCGRPTTNDRFRFSASLKAGTQDKWAQYRLSAAELPVRIMKRLEDLENSG
ncbi:hypothetical protein [Naasia sp. SYSU D00948]|uniref:hypothetical protein n=1 Tax=Naasia sp. SYSU D00948 TaxID=2817379 RepID=UPI001B3115CE|nr:hypothetical protein [Naasia sp. SYSU D00948]